MRSSPSSLPPAIPPSARRPLATVVVTAAEETRADLSRCLTGLLAQDAGRGRYEIIVVGVGAAANDLMALIGRTPELRAATEPKMDTAAAQNRGLAMATAPIVAFIEDSLIPPPDWLRRLIAAFEAGTPSADTTPVYRTDALRARGGFPEAETRTIPAAAPPARHATSRHSSITTNPRQAAATVAVVIPTILRPTLLRAVRSVYSQDFDGTIQVLIGVDVATGDTGLLDTLRAECPPHVTLSVLDLGYSTSQRHGGLYSNHYSGALRTILSFAANARHVAYLDDNDWFGRDHLAALMRAVQGKSWAFSLRWFVDEPTLLPITRDEWNSLGPDRGIDAERFGGFVSPATLLLDKLACESVLPLWSHALGTSGTGEDRRVFAALRGGFPWGATEAYTSFCTLSEATQRDEHHAREFSRRGIAWVVRRTLLRQVAQHLEEARGAAEAGRWSDAASACQAALAIVPHHAEVLQLAALSEWKGGRPDRAIQLLHDAIAVEDGSDQPFAALAEILMDTGEETAARAVLEQALRRFPRSAPLAAQRASFEQGSGAGPLFP